MDTKKILTVLTVEDDEFLSKLVSGRLLELGFAVIAVDSGNDGMSQARIEHPDLILLDIMLPDVNGFLVLETLKKDENTKHIPIIVLSNLGGQDDIEKGIALGASAYLVKSAVLPNEVAKVVQETINATA
jgi:CheY-like chemotaxis protein